MSDLLNILGLIFSLLGSLSLVRGLFISRKEALELGVSRWVGEADSENLKLPQVRDRLKQRKWGMIGAVLLFVGFTLQLFGQIL